MTLVSSTTPRLRLLFPSGDKVQELKMVHQRPQIAREETGKKATTMVSRRGLTKYPTTTPLKGTSGRHLIQSSPLGKLTLQTSSLYTPAGLQSRFHSLILHPVLVLTQKAVLWVQPKSPLLRNRLLTPPNTQFTYFTDKTIHGLGRWPGLISEEEPKIGTHERTGLMTGRG